MRGGGITSIGRGRPVASCWFSPESTLFQDSARTTPAVANNDPVGSWSDRGTAGVNQQQATAANRPLLKTNILNGFSVLDFDGVNDSMTAAWTALTAYTVFMVARKKAAPTVAERTLLGVRLGSSRLRPLVSNSSGTYAPNFGFFCTDAIAYQAWPAATVTDWNILSFVVVSSAVCHLRANGGAPTVFDAHDLVTTATTFSFCVDNTTNFGDYQIAEFRRYPKVLEIGGMNYVGRELGEKYGLAWTQAQAA